MAVKAPMTGNLPATYERDYYAWTQESATKLRAGQFADLDFEHIAEEIEDMGKRDRRKVGSHLEVIIQHLLKWEQQPELRSRSWTVTIGTQRGQIETLLEESPSLKQQLTEEFLSRCYRRGLSRCALETGLGKECFPAANRYTLEQLLTDWWPD